VRERRFPGEEYTYPIKDDELSAVRASDRWKTVSASSDVKRGNSNLPEGF
jgi:hypothetical protein